MSERRGQKYWFIADGFIPPISNGDQESHESICVLNCNVEQIELEVIVYFEDRDPLEGLFYSIDGRRTKHIRTSWLKNDQGEQIPAGVPYAMEVRSNQAIIVQYSRLDSTQKELALMTTMGYS